MNLLRIGAATVVCAAGACAAQSESVERERLMGELAALPTQRSARGTVESQRGLVETESHLERRLREMGHEPVRFPLSWNLKSEAAERGTQGVDHAPWAREVDEELAARTWHNLIVDLPGRETPKEVLIVGAHFDAAPGAPGADDNGTGTAALLELARVLKDVPMKRSVRLIFFNLEEIGLKGSAEYVRKTRAKWSGGEETIVGMVSLEMLGYFTDEPGSQRSPIPAIEGVFDPPTVGDFIAIGTTKKHAPFAKRLEEEMRRAAPGLKTIAPDFLPDLPLAPPDLMRSDNGPFMWAGLPAVMLTDTSNFRNPNYHRATDTIETIDAERFTLVVKGLAGAIQAIAGEVEGAGSP